MTRMRSYHFASMVVLAMFATSAFAADLRVPATVAAGNGLSVSTSGSGAATLFLVGPGTAVKRQVQLGQEVQLTSEDLQKVGRYTVVIGDDSASFYVTPGPVSSIAFLARPSRVPRFGSTRSISWART